MPRKKPTRTSLRIKADTLFSKLIRLIGYCVRCGATDRLQCSHRMSRRYLSTRWDIDNADCLCASCHLFFTMHPLEFEQWLIQTIGRPLLESLKQRALQIARPDYEAVIARLKEQAASGLVSS